MKRCLSDAKAIVEDGHRIFGTRVPVETARDWISIPGTDLHWPRESFWWDIDIRTDARLGDVKWTWELGRHRDLVVLARAAAIEPEGPWLGALEQRLRTWFEASPSEVGVHWYSNLEIALRLISWIQIFTLTHEVLDPRLVTTMTDHVGRAERHLVFDFPYTVSSMRNNHLLGDALGLLAIDRFTGGDGRRRTARLAERSFSKQLTRHMHPDGSMIEDSLSYHRFVLEMLLIKRLLGDHSKATGDALIGAAQHLENLGVFDGELPQWGDWDEGRVLAASGDALDVAGSTAAALVAVGSGFATSYQTTFDEVAWYTRQSSTPDALPLTSGSTSGGIAYLRHGPWSAWLKGELGHSHQHSDLGHVSLRHEDTWVLVDPGTATYNGELEIRNAFRTSRAHNGTRLSGAEHLTPHRAFRWLGEPIGASAPALRIESASIAFSAHNAFVPQGAGRTARAVVLTDSAMVCIDWQERAAPTQRTVALSPKAVVDSGLVTIDTKQFSIDLGDDVQSSYADRHPFGGWFSRTYGSWEPSTWLSSDLASGVCKAWSIADSENPLVHVSGSRVIVEDLVFDIAFESDSVRLVVVEGHAKHRSSAAIAR